VFVSFFCQINTDLIILYNMARSNYYRVKYQINDICSNLWRMYGIKTLIIFAVFILGVVIGIVITSPLIPDLSIDNMSDTAMLSFLCRDSNFLSLFISYLIVYLLLILYSMFINRNIVLYVINLIILFFFGYVWGCNFIILISFINFLAFVFAIIIIPVFNILIVLLYSLILAIVWKKNMVVRKYGCYDGFNYQRLIVILGILDVILLFLYCLSLNLIICFYITT